MFPHVFHAVAAEDCGFWVVESASGQAWQVDPAEVHDLRISMRHRRMHVRTHQHAWQRVDRCARSRDSRAGD